MTEKDAGQELIQVIRQIVKEEVYKIINQKVECSTKAQIVKMNTDKTVNVYIFEIDKTINNIPNKSNEDLLDGDIVKLYYQNNYVNGYIGCKI